MGKIALLVPREEMVYQAHNILQEKSYREKHYEISIMKVVRTRNIVTEARQAIAGGASIIIARGLQASIIKQYTDIPVIEIVITAQEMALLIVKARQILKKTNPVIAVVGFRNMFCDMSYFDSIYDIELRTFYAPNNEQLRDYALRAVEEKVDLVIGGEVAVETAAEHNVPSLFLSNTEDSLRNAFSMAESVSYAMDVEKKNAAQMETLLDYSFGGVVNVDGKGRITAVNPLMEDLLGQPRGELTGKTLTEIFPDLDRKQVEKTLTGEGEGCSAFLQLKSGSVFAILAPVLIEGRADGAILTCHKMMRKLPAEPRAGERRRTGSVIALRRFSDILQESQAMEACVHKARLYALSDLPVLIEGEAGTEGRLLAQSIHNESARYRNGFAHVSCGGLGEEEQYALLFDEDGAAARADGGTVFIEDADWLTPANQFRLLTLLRYKLRPGKTVSKDRHGDVRVMVMVQEPGQLERMAREGSFRKDLYYLLQGLSLAVPPLRDRPEDLKKKIETSIRDSCERFQRHHQLEREAMEFLLACPWPGNLYQVENYCERLILTASRRVIGRTAAERLMEELYPAGNLSGKAESRENFMQQAQEGAAGGMTESRKKTQLLKALKENDGNRAQTAEALGVSKATLWRWMKKYGILEGEDSRNLKE